MCARARVCVDRRVGVRTLRVCARVDCASRASLRVCVQMHELAGYSGGFPLPTTRSSFTMLLIVLAFLFLLLVNQ